MRAAFICIAIGIALVAKRHAVARRVIEAQLRLIAQQQRRYEPPSNEAALSRILRAVGALAILYGALLLMNEL